MFTDRLVLPQCRDLRRTLATRADADATHLTCAAQFWAAYVPCESQYKNAVQMTLEQVDLIKRVVRQYSDYLSLALTAEGETDPAPDLSLALTAEGETNPAPVLLRQ